MRRLLLLRHSKAEKIRPGERDFDRPLADRGREHAPQVGIYLAKHAVLDSGTDLALVSPAARTRETWELVAAELADGPKATFEPRIYEAESETLLAIVKDTKRSVRNLVMVGHNPGMHDLATMLTATGDIEARQQLNEGLPTSGLVIIEFAFDRWDHLHEQSGRLEHFITPRSLASASD
jgi:phosphohistidine phosphatase